MRGTEKLKQQRELIQNVMPDKLKCEKEERSEQKGQETEEMKTSSTERMWQQRHGRHEAIKKRLGSRKITREEGKGEGR